MTAKESKAVARFDLDSSYESRHGVRMYECADGDYVLYDDHQSALHAAEAERDALQSRLDAVGRLADALVGQADDAYVRYIGALNTDECKGRQFKMHRGKFGEAELEAHKKAASLFSKHHELMAVANELRSAALGCATTGEMK
jgi:hypothetical protein